MARFLFTVWSFPGHINPSMAIAQALRGRGHEVAFYTGRRAQSTVEGEGFSCFPFRHLDEERVHRLVFMTGGTLLPWKSPSSFVSVLRDWLLATLPDQVKDQEGVLDSWRPDGIVCDVTMWGPTLVLHEARGIPVAVSSYAPGCMIPGPDVPPWGLGLPRPRNGLTRLVSRAVGAATDWQVAKFRRIASEIRSRYRLPPLTGPVHHFLGRMPLYLVPSVPELDYDRRDLPPSVHYVGPLVWNGRRDELPPSESAALPRRRPCVHVTEGTMHARAPFLLRAAARGLANLPVEVIMTTGVYREPTELDLGPIGANVRVLRWVPHGELLPHIDVVVTTGGAGTVLAALQAGVPLVVVPTEWDKPDNAQRVVEAGAGVRLSPWRCTPRRLRRAVERVLGNGSFRWNAERLAATFPRYGGAARAAELLEKSFGVGSR